MAGDTNTCPKCQARMEEGYIVDETYYGRLVSARIEGAPVKSFWTGVRRRGLRERKTETWRRTACGFLETYAP